MRPNLGYYVKNINEIIKQIEELGESLNPYYEEIRGAIDDNKVSELGTERLTEIHDFFQKGTKKYEELLKQAKDLKAPAKVIGVQKKFEKAFTEYTAGCDEMTRSLDPENGSVDVALFNSSEQKQDETTDTITFCIQRITSLLMK